MNPRVSRLLLLALLVVCALFLVLLLGGRSNENLAFRLLEIRWTNDQPYAVLECRYPPFAGLMPRFDMTQREKLMVRRNGDWQLEGTPYDPARGHAIVEKIYPNRHEPLNLRIARYSVRIPHAEQWRFEVDSFETRLLGYPVVRKQISRDYFWKSPEFPGVAKMLESNLTNAAAVVEHLRLER